MSVEVITAIGEVSIPFFSGLILYTLATSGVERRHVSIPFFSGLILYQACPKLTNRGKKFQSLSFQGLFCTDRRNKRRFFMGLRRGFAIFAHVARDVYSGAFPKRISPHAKGGFLANVQPFAQAQKGYEGRQLAGKRPVAEHAAQAHFLPLPG